MSKILLIGKSPPPLVQSSKVEAAHHRTWQFLQSLLEDGHQIYLCGVASNSTRSETSPPIRLSRNFRHEEIHFNRLGWRRELQRSHDRFKPDCVVAVNFDACLYSTKLATDKPIWMDIYGDYLTIVQASRYRAQSDRGVSTSIGFITQVLRQGDKFSVCSVPQGHALVGELAMAGRLNWRSFGYPFTEVIRPASPPLTVVDDAGRGKELLSTLGIGESDFVVLWCGGYNAWTDVETLFRALELAMDKSPRIHFVSLGENTYEAADNVYSRIIEMVHGSRHSGRFHMLGWQPWSEVARYYQSCDLGINIDTAHYETIYGTRTRLLDMMASGLPIITSLGCELSYILKDRGVALTFDPHDWQSLGQQIVLLASDRDHHRQMAKSALNSAANEFSFAATTMPLRTWVKEPLLAPDKVRADHREKLRLLEYQIRAKMRHLIWDVAGLDR